MSGFFKLKDAQWLENQRVAGKVVAQALMLLENEVKNKTKLTTLELSRLAENFILSKDCLCTFKNYKGFPEAVCISVNKQLVHGIPDNYTLQEGDVIKFDLGATYKNAIADSALTCIYGEPIKSEHIKLIESTEEALLKGIKSIDMDCQIGSIGHAINKSAKNNGFNIINNYGGHGICNHEDGSGMPHAPPFVANKANTNEGIRFAPGLVLAIEPLLCIGSPETKTSNDKWTVTTEGINAHFEHSVFIHEDHVEIITWREGSSYPNKIYFGELNGKT